MIKQKEIVLPRFRRGYHLIDYIIEEELKGFLPETGLLHIFIKHTSAAITLNENADPSVRVDFETIMNQLVPEGQNVYTHTTEGDDDMPAHIKASLIGSSITIPITNGSLNKGMWQGIYLCEFRNFGSSRKLVLTVYS
ncbi:MAG: secondary thiamine-phosphate synthase enzyme YjbQ [Bacteroidales bacterium]|nr:secondary thiamine-phosphate synthase enzyme YjbQ [Bacteroidales bacterium]